MAKRVPSLSSSQFKNLKPHTAKTIELVDGAVAGLRLRISPAGTLTWSLNVRDVKGRRRRFDIGQGLGLADARRRAETLRTAIRCGADPTAEKRIARERTKSAESGIGTFGSVVSAYYTNGPGKLLDTRDEQERRIRHVFGKVLGRPATEIPPSELQVTADQHPSASSASHAVAYLRPLAKWAAKRALMRMGFDELEKPITASGSRDDGQGQRVLSPEELSKILPSLGYQGHDAAARFMLLTGCRLDEACSATWAEVDLELKRWVIPAGRRKDTRSKSRKKQVATQDHVVVLPDQAVALLEGLGSGLTDELIFQGERGSRLQNWDRWSKRQWILSGVYNWDRHALRRTTATLAGELGAPPHIISALLGHRNIGDQLTAGYSKARYTAEVGDILQKVANQFEVIEAAKDNVIRLNRFA